MLNLLSGFNLEKLGPVLFYIMIGYLWCKMVLDNIQRFHYYQINVPIFRWNYVFFIRGDCNMDHVSLAVNLYARNLVFWKRTQFYGSSEIWLLLIHVSLIGSTCANTQIYFWRFNLFLLMLTINNVSSIV